MMMKRVLLYGIVMAILMMVAFSAGQWDKDTAVLQQHADEIAVFCSNQAEAAQKWLQAHPDLLQKPESVDWDECAQQSFTLIIHQRDSVLFWSNTRVIPGKKRLNMLLTAPERQVLQLPLGWFLVLGQNWNGQRVSIFIPIRYTINDQQAHPFPADASIGNNLFVSAQATDMPVILEEKPLFWLSSDGMVQSSWLQWIKLVAFLLLLGMGLILADRGSDWLQTRYGPGAAVLGPTILAALLIGGNLFTAFLNTQFSNLPLFQRIFEGDGLMGLSLGDWLVHVGVLGWLSISFHRNLQNLRLVSNQTAVRTAFLVLNYGLTMCSVPIAVQIMRRVAIQDEIPVDYNDLLNLNALSFLSALGILSSIFALFLFNHRLALIIRDSQIQRNRRYTSVVIAGLVFGVVCALWPGGFGILLVWPILLGLAYAVLLDSFVHTENPGFGWIILWLLFFSFCSSLFLRQYQRYKGQKERIAYARALGVLRDEQYAEPFLPGIYEQLRQDSATLNVLLRPWPFKASEAELAQHFNAEIFRSNYLFQHYRTHIFAFDKEQQALILGQTGSYAKIVGAVWNHATPLPNSPWIRYGCDEEGQFHYMMAFSALRMGDASQAAQVYCFLTHEYPQPTRVYAQLFFNSPFKNLTHLRDYDFAVMQQGKLMVEQGQFNYKVLETPLENAGVREIRSGSPVRLDAVYKSEDGQTVAGVGRKLSSWAKQMYLFSLLFVFAALMLLIMAGLNAWLGFLPAYFQFHLRISGSLARRIHFWNIALIGGAFMVIGAMTYWHFTAASTESERAGIDYRADAVLVNLKSQLLNSSLSADSMQQTLPVSLASMSNSLSMDAALYDQNGELRFTTQSALAGLGILPEKMNPSALTVLRKNAYPEWVEAENLAGFGYFTKYMPLFNGQNKLLGYLGIPFQLGEAKAGSEVSDFIGILASLYVFLLLIAYVVTLFLAQSIIKPIRLISDRIKKLRLEDKNETLDYQGDPDDELSILINRYNNMVDQLEESKLQMIRLEREGAWREMARQVAHDIKNPLTTMKLSMQQLERVSSDPEQAAAYLRKAITRLIEQIDSLAQIASEFSMFANLDIREKHDMVINEVVENVHDLFSEQKNVNLDLQLPDKRFHILGDKNHLIRVFNNLVINAIQAIPSDRRGHIRVSLYQKGQVAVVQIGDNGGGIPEEIQKRVFEPNFTTKTSGSGLGLAICKKIIEAHDGDIHFKTVENEGTDFFVELPISLTQAR